MQNLEPLLTIRDIMRIFNLERVSVYRRLREARAGRGGLPLPIETGAKRNLRWTLDSVKEFFQISSSTSENLSTLEMENTHSKKKRHAEAMQTLKRLGVKITK